jgi:hypothetical protein
LWWLWENGSQPIQVVATTDTMHMVTDKGRLWSWGNGVWNQANTGGGGNAAVPQIGVTETRSFKRIFVSDYSVFAESDITVEPYLKRCGTSAARFPAEMPPQPAAIIRVSGWGFGASLTGIKVSLTFSDSSTASCIPSALEALDDSDSRKRTLTCIADLSSAPVGGITGRLSINNEVSNEFVAGTIIPTPELTNDGSAMYRHANSSIVFTITGRNFGTCPSSVSVSFEIGTVVTPCFVQEAYDSYLVCATTSGLPSGSSPNITVSRISATGSMNAYFQIVESPVVFPRSTVFPNSVRELEIFGSNFGGSDTIVTVAGSNCDILNQTSSYIRCALPSRFSDYTGYVDAVVYANQGSSGAPVTVGSLSFPPVAASNDKGLVAAGAEEISIRGLRFGSVSEVEVSIVVNTTSSKRSLVEYPCTVSNIVVDTTTLYGEEILRCVPSIGSSGLPAGQVSAVVNRNGGTTQIALGSVVPNPSISGSQLPTWAKTIPTITISGSNFAPTPNHLSNVVTLSESSCSVGSATATQIVCVIGPAMNGTRLSASVKTYGASTPTVPIGNLIDPPFINSTVDLKIPTRSTSVTIVGQNFAGSSATVQLFLNALTPSCRTLAESTRTQIVCSVDETALDETGSLFAIVGSFGVFTDKTQIGGVERAPGNGTNIAGNVLGTNGIIGVAIAVAAFVIIVLAVTVIVIRRYKLSQDIKLRDAAMKISQEAKGLFNIKASDITVISKLGEGSFGAVYLGKYRGSHVAIKRLATNVLASQINDFFREAVRSQM